MINSKRLKKTPIEEPHLNLTPLIDVVFVLLIGFIIIAPLLHIDEIDLADAPKNQEAAKTPASSPIAIHVKSDNSIWWEDKNVSITELEDLLGRAKDQHPDVTPQLFHDRRGYFGTYQNVKNALEAAGFEKVDLILQPI